MHFNHPITHTSLQRLPDTAKSAFNCLVDIICRRVVQEMTNAWVVVFFIFSLQGDQTRQNDLVLTLYGAHKFTSFTIWAWFMSVSTERLLLKWVSWKQREAGGETAPLHFHYSPLFQWFVWHSRGSKRWLCFEKKTTDWKWEIWLWRVSKNQKNQKEI